MASISRSETMALSTITAGVWNSGHACKRRGGGTFVHSNFDAPMESVPHATSRSFYGVYYGLWGGMVSGEWIVEWEVEMEWMGHSASEKDTWKVCCR